MTLWKSLSIMITVTLVFTPSGEMAFSGEIRVSTPRMYVSFVFNVIFKSVTSLKCHEDFKVAFPETRNLIN